MSAAEAASLATIQTPQAGGVDNPDRRGLLIVNPYASAVSDSLSRDLAATLKHALRLDIRETKHRDHATALGREAAAAGYDLVIALGGDGTINETANGLAGTTVPLAFLPGGRANVYCRMLDVPTNPLRAAERLVSLTQSWRPRAVDLGRVGERLFLFSAGVGLDASVVRRVDAHSRLKTRLGHYFYVCVAVSTYCRRYLRNPPRMTVRLGPASAGAATQTLNGVTTLVQNASPYTYFGGRAIEMAVGASLDSGDLAGLVLRRSSPLDLPTIAWRALAPNASVAGHREVDAFKAQRVLEVRSSDQRELPLQVDGDYIGSAPVHRFSVMPRALTVLC